MSVTLFLCLGLKSSDDPHPKSLSLQGDLLPGQYLDEVGQKWTTERRQTVEFPSRGFLMWTRPNLKKTGPISFLVAFKEEIPHKISDYPFKSVLKLL